MPVTTTVDSRPAAAKASCGTDPQRCCSRARATAASWRADAVSRLSRTTPKGTMSVGVPDRSRAATSWRASPAESATQPRIASAVASPVAERRRAIRPGRLGSVDHWRTAMRSMGPSGRPNSCRAAAASAWSAVRTPAGAGGHSAAGESSRRPVATSRARWIPRSRVSTLCAEKRCLRASQGSG